MGTNRRYPQLAHRLADQRELRTAAAAGPLQSLTNAELELSRQVVTRDPQPKPARAWVRFGATAVRVDVEVCQWTDRAIAIRFRVDDTEYRAWVWSSAVSPHPPAVSGG